MVEISRFFLPPLVEKFPPLVEKFPPYSRKVSTLQSKSFHLRNRTQGLKPLINEGFQCFKKQQKVPVNIVNIVNIINIQENLTSDFRRKSRYFSGLVI